MIAEHGPPGNSPGAAQKAVILNPPQADEESLFAFRR